jgi:hypothetical protein
MYSLSSSSSSLLETGASNLKGVPDRSAAARRLGVSPRLLYPLDRRSGRSKPAAARLRRFLLEDDRYDVSRTRSAKSIKRLMATPCYRFGLGSHSYHWIARLYRLDHPQFASSSLL